MFKNQKGKSVHTPKQYWYDTQSEKDIWMDLYKELYTHK